MSRTQNHQDQATIIMPAKTKPRKNKAQKGKGKKANKRRARPRAPIVVNQNNGRPRGRRNAVSAGRTICSTACDRYCLTLLHPESYNHPGPADVSTRTIMSKSVLDATIRVPAVSNGYTHVLVTPPMVSRAGLGFDGRGWYAFNTNTQFLNGSAFLADSFDRGYWSSNPFVQGVDLDSTTAIFPSRIGGFGATLNTNGPVLTMAGTVRAETSEYYLSQLDQYTGSPPHEFDTLNPYTTIPPYSGESVLIERGGSLHATWFPMNYGATTMIEGGYTLNQMAYVPKAIYAPAVEESTLSLRQMFPVFSGEGTGGAAWLHFVTDAPPNTTFRLRAVILIETRVPPTSSMFPMAIPRVPFTSQLACMEGTLRVAPPGMALACCAKTGNHLFSPGERGPDPIAGLYSAGPAIPFSHGAPTTMLGPQTALPPAGFVTTPSGTAIGPSKTISQYAKEATTSALNSAAGAAASYAAPKVANAGRSLFNRAATYAGQAASRLWGSAGSEVAELAGLIESAGPEAALALAVAL